VVAVGTTAESMAVESGPARLAACPAVLKVGVVPAQLAPVVSGTAALAAAAWPSGRRGSRPR